MDDEYVLTKLDSDSANSHGVGRFAMADPKHFDFKNFLRKYARKSVKSCLTQTYVACHQNQPSTVVGYVSIMCAEVSLDDTYLIPDKPGADRYDMHPAARIARLAVADGHRGKGLGEKLMGLAGGIISAQIRPLIGCRFIILDAAGESIGFYRRLGFRTLDTESNLSKATPIMFLDLGQLT